MVACDHLNHFHQCHFQFQPVPTAAVWRSTKYIEDAVAQSSRNSPRYREPSGGALSIRQLFQIPVPLLLLAAIFVMYVILVILYESYVHAFTVLFPPLSLRSSADGHIVYFRIPCFHSTAWIRLFLLLVIVKKNGSLWFISGRCNT